MLWIFLIIELKIFTSPNLFNSPAAIAKGADLLPGHSIKFWTPIFIRRFKSCKLLRKFLHSIDDVIIYINSLGFPSKLNQIKHV